MGVRLVNNIPAQIARQRERMARDQNRKRDAHLEFAHARAPKDKGNLDASIRADGDATPQRPLAVAKVGGVEVNGVTVDYAGHVNFGHATVNGGHVPADPFWTEAEEVGRRA